MASIIVRVLLVVCVAISFAACVPVSRAPVSEAGSPQAESAEVSEAAAEPSSPAGPVDSAPLIDADELPAAEGPAEAAVAKPVETFDRGDVIWIQTRLQQMGYYDGQVDGEVGQATRAAVRDYQKDQNIKVDGRPTPTLREFIWRNGG